MDQTVIANKIERILKAVQILTKAEDDELKDALPDDFPIKDELVESVNDWEKDLAKVLREQAKFYASKLRDYVTKAEDDGLKASELFAFLLQYQKNDKFKVKAQEVNSKAMEKQVGDFTSVFMDLIDKDVSFNSKITQETYDWLSDWSWELTDLLDSFNMSAIEGAIAKGLENGWGIEKIADELEKLDDFDRKRARRVALTETLTCSSVAQQEAFKQSPSVKKKGWRHSGARKNTPRPAHVALDGTEISVDDEFIVNGKKGLYPRATTLPASERVYCHCVMYPVIDQDIFGLSADEKQAIRDSVINGTPNPVLDLKPVKDTKKTPKVVEPIAEPEVPKVLGEGVKDFHKIRGTKSDHDYIRNMKKDAVKELIESGTDKKVAELMSKYLSELHEGWKSSSTSPLTISWQAYLAKQHGIDADFDQFFEDIYELDDLQKWAADYIHGYTQNLLAQSGYTHIKLYRGVYWYENSIDGEIPDWIPAPKDDSTYKFVGRAMSSWSVDKKIAQSFARMTNKEEGLKGAVFETEVPISQVHSMYDLFGEVEVVPLGDVSNISVEWKNNVNVNNIVRKAEEIIVSPPWDTDDWIREWREENKVAKRY